MGGLSTIEAVYIALVFIVPGYIFLSLRNQFIAGQDRLGTDQILSFLTYSALNFALFGWIVYLVISYGAPPYAHAVAWFFVLVVIPAAFGLICGVCSQRELVARIYQFFRLNPVHPTPRAWDKVFFTNPPSWVLITLKNGGQVAGFWGGDSFASSDQKERDLYISQIFEISGDEPWKPTGKSLFVAAGEIRTIEFIPAVQDRQHDQGSENSEHHESRQADQ
jgi:Family of unknown function (DUF6338)